MIGGIVPPKGTTSVFDALSIGGGLVAAVLLCMKRGFKIVEIQS